MTEHVLKIHPQPLADLLSGAKTAEVRDCSDRDFQVGDTVRLRELTGDGYTGREVTRTISHVQVGYGLPVGLCVLSYAATPMARSEFEPWLLGRAHPVYGWLDQYWLARGDDPETYAEPYVQGLWVALGEQQ